MVLPSMSPMTWSTSSPLFADRRDAGRRLAVPVRALRLEDPLVVGVPHGGVAVASEISRALGAPLDIWVCRKLVAPESRDTTVGALSEGGELVFDPELINDEKAARSFLGVQAQLVMRDAVVSARRLREGRPQPCVRRREVVVIDDGVATGLTARAALGDLRGLGARRLVFATPVGAVEALSTLAEVADEVICLAPLKRPRRICAHYGSFPALCEPDVVQLLLAARRRAA